MKSFIVPGAETFTERQADHGGVGAILFQRLLRGCDLRSAIDFVDHTVVLPGSTIGKHHHQGNEEIYFIVNGNPLMRVNGQEARLQKGDLSIVRHEEWHELVNDTEEDVEILVVQAALRESAG